MRDNQFVSRQNNIAVVPAIPTFLESFKEWSVFIAFQQVLLFASSSDVEYGYAFSFWKDIEQRFVWRLVKGLDDLSSLSAPVCEPLRQDRLSRYEEGLLALLKLFFHGSGPPYLCLQPLEVCFSASVILKLHALAGLFMVGPKFGRRLLELLAERVEMLGAGVKGSNESPFMFI